MMLHNFSGEEHSVFTEKDIADKVREIAETQPDTVYLFREGQRACFYVPGDAGEQRCLIGAALSDLGVPDSFFRQPTLHNSDRTINASGYEKIRPYLQARGYLSTLHYTDNSQVSYLTWLVAVQDCQDSGEAWGHAVRLADEVHPIRGA
jgi:hypothetical protein